MANFFKQLMGSLRLQDDEDDLEDSFDLKEESEKERVRKRAVGSNTSGTAGFAGAREEKESTPHIQKAHTVSNYGSSTYIENRNNVKSIRMERPEGSKVIPISTTRRGHEVCIMKPKNFEDSQDICDVLLSERAAIVNLEENDIELSQRIMDFISGAVYSLNGKLYQISGLIFIVTPESVDISGDYNELLAQSGFDVPVFNKGF